MSSSSYVEEEYEEDRSYEVPLKNLWDIQQVYKCFLATVSKKKRFSEEARFDTKALEIVEAMKAYVRTTNQDMLRERRAEEMRRKNQAERLVERAAPAVVEVPNPKTEETSTQGRNEKVVEKRKTQMEVMEQIIVEKVLEEDGLDKMLTSGVNESKKETKPGEAQEKHESPEQKKPHEDVESSGR